MANSLAEKFLKNYHRQTEVLLKNYFKNKIKDAQKIGSLSGEVLNEFALIAERGKKIRGSLVVLGYQLAGGKKLSSIYDASLFIEIFHSGILVHDDIMDQDILRRGLTTLHVKLGIPLAICAGDVAFYLAWEKLLNSRFPKDRLIMASQLYSEYVIRLIQGQILDVNNLSFNQLSNRNILDIFKYKTAEYTGVLPLLIGAILGGMKEESRLEQLKEYGISLGWAFQIKDDILGLYGRKEKTGKSIASDLRGGKITLLIYYALKHGNREEKKFVKSVLGKKNISETEIVKTQRFFKDIGAHDYVVKMGQKYAEQGIKAISKITINKNLQEILHSFLIYVTDRTS